MKLMVIVNNVCYYTSTYPNYKWDGSLVVNAPDYVIEGWGYDPTLSGDARFIRVYTPEVQRKTRQYLYESSKRIRYAEDYITVDDANKRFSEYFAEGDTVKCNELQTLIEAAKAAIREEYPDDINS